MLNMSQTVIAGYILDLSTGYYIITKYRINIRSKQKIGPAKVITLIKMRNINAVIGINTHKSAGGKNTFVLGSVKQVVY